MVRTSHQPALLLAAGLALLPSLAFGQSTTIMQHPSIYLILGPQGPAGSGTAAPLASNAVPGLMRAMVPRSRLTPPRARPAWSVRQPCRCLVNHGTNDSSDVTANATASVNALLAACPSARLVLLNPFPKADMAGLQAAAAGCAAPVRVRWVSTAGFFNTALGCDSYSLHPSGPNGVLVIAPKVAVAVRPLLSGGVLDRWTHSSTTSGSTIAPDGTLSGLPSTIVAGQALSAVTFTPPQTAIYFVLYNVTGAVEEGSRWSNNVMAGNLTLLIPQVAGDTYTVRAYSAATGGTLAYESAHIAVTAAPGALPATPVQAADSGATSSSVTMNWSATAGELSGARTGGAWVRLWQPGRYDGLDQQLHVHRAASQQHAPSRCHSAERERLRDAQRAVPIVHRGRGKHARMNVLDACRSP